MSTTIDWERPAPQPSPSRHTDPVWRKAPALLVRTPSLLVAIVGAATLLGVAAASGPLYLASAQQATMDAEVAALDPGEAGLRVEVPIEPASFAALDGLLTAEVDRRLPELSAPHHLLRTPPLDVDAGAEAIRARLVGETSAEAGEGVAVPAAVAEQLGVSAGDTVTLSRSGQSVSATVASTPARPVDGEWAELVATPDEVRRLAESLDATLEATWVFPLEAASGLDVEQVAGRLRAAQQAITDRGAALGAGVAEHAVFRTRIATASDLPAATRRIREAAAAVEPPVRSLWVTAVLVGLVVMGGAAGLRVRRRRREHTMLATRGVAPWSQSSRAALESVLPVAAGIALGVVAAGGLVAALDPGGHVADATGRAAAAGAVAGVGAVLLVAAVTAVSLRGGHVRATKVRAVAAKVPWELLPVGLAALAYTRLRLPAAPSGAAVDPLVLAFPLLALLGAVGVAIRLLAAALPRLRGLGRGLPPERLLVLRRLAGAPGATLSLVGVTTLTVGLLVAAATLASSAAATAGAKAAVAVGADAAAPAASVSADTLPPQTTLVGRAEGRVDPGGDRVDLLVVDRGSFAAAAAWHATFAERPLDTLVADLAPTSDDVVPVLVVGPLERAPARLVGPGFTVAVDAVGEASAFPGFAGTQPMLVMDVAALEAARAEGDRPLDAALAAEAWAAGPDAAEGVVAAGGDDAAVRTAAAEADSPALRAARWSLAYLQGVALAAGLLAVLAVALVMTERQRAREVAYALARRMGLTRNDHRRAVAMELGVLLAVSVSLAIVLGIAVAALTVPAVDPQPAQPPRPLLDLPFGVLAGVAAAAVACCVAGARWVQHAADRTRVGEVLRAAE